MPNPFYMNYDTVVMVSRVTSFKHCLEGVNYTFSPLFTNDLMMNSHNFAETPLLFEVIYFLLSKNFRGYLICLG